MSTRAHIRVIDSSGIIMLYHHCDGYPEGIGRDLIQNKLGLNDTTYAPATCIHGDEEYVYVIDCRDRTIKCFRHGWDESFEDCFKAEREEIIPN